MRMNQTNCKSFVFNIIFCWLLCHKGNSGNEKPDKTPKSALNKLILQIPMPYTNLKPIINKYIYNMWPQTWNSQTKK